MRKLDGEIGFLFFWLASSFFRWFQCSGFLSPFEAISCPVQSLDGEEMTLAFYKSACYEVSDCFEAENRR